MIAHHQGEPIAAIHSLVDQRLSETVGVGIKIGVCPGLVGRGPTVETQVLKGQYVEVGRLQGLAVNKISEDSIVAFAHGRQSVGEDRDTHGRGIGTDGATTIMGETDGSSLHLSISGSTLDLFGEFHDLGYASCAYWVAFT
jgi:hypothetical protein